MMPAPTKPATVLAGGICFCCRRRDEGIAVPAEKLRFGEPRLHWSCVDHIHLAERAIEMPRARFDQIEALAFDDAAMMAAEYLESIGKTDIAKLEKFEITLLGKAWINSFGESLARRLSELE